MVLYSRMGGVLVPFRRQGLATALAGVQEKRAKEHGFFVIVMKTRNCRREMRIFALKRGFSSTGFTPKAAVDQHRIWLQKTFD